MDVPENSIGLHVLIVEDDVDTQENLRDILELDDHLVSLAGSAREIRERPDLARVDVVILDRKLPDATAEELLPYLKEAAPDADVIVVTGYGDVEGAIQALRKGAADYILKPINPDFLRASINRTAEKHRLARAREQSETAFRLLVETAECLVLIVRPDGRLLFLNPFAAALCGLANVEVARIEGVEQIVPPQFRERFKQDVFSQSPGEPLRGLEAPLLTAEKRERWVLWNACHLPEYEGHRVILMVGLDVTDRRKAQEQVLQSERLAAIGQMVTGLAHESRNALQRSQACLENLTLEIEDRPEALKLVERIQKAQDHLHHLYEEVRSYAGPIVLRKKRCDLQEVIRSTWADLEVIRRGRDLRLTILPEAADGHCLADRHGMEQVFCNILENSIAASPPRGEVRVLLQSSDIDGASAVCVRICDDGPGLSAEQAERIFEPFFTTKTAGTGLGMAITRRIVEAHSGKIGVGPNQPGATIVVTLPRQ